MLTKPAVHKRWLLLVSGLLWSGTGIMLNSFAYRWTDQFNSFELLIIITCGILLSMAITIFGFRHIAAKNIARIQSLPASVCVFAFQAWESYFLILVMMSMGIFLRTSPIFPKLLLAPMYIGIGAALFINSFPYYIKFNKTLKNKAVKSTK